MNIMRYLIGDEDEEDKGLFAQIIGQQAKHLRSLVVNGELSHEKMKILMPAYDATLSFIKVGSAAMRIFRGPDIPDDIGEEIKTGIEKLRGMMAKYIDGTVDAAGMKAAVKEGRAKAAEIRKALRTRS